MPERTIPAEAYVTQLICKCGGVMSYTGKEIPSHPIKFQYECEKCKVRELNTTRYPHISYKPFDIADFELRVSKILAQRLKR